jgi:hypothetical protein
MSFRPFCLLLHGIQRGWFVDAWPTTGLPKRTWWECTVVEDCEGVLRSGASFVVHVLKKISMAGEWRCEGCYRGIYAILLFYGQY